MAKPKKPLIPPDLERCQADIPTGHSFMTLGGRPGKFDRCTKKPTVIITEVEASDERGKGQMSLCDGCLAVFRKQMPKGVAIVDDITDEFPARWVRVTCDLCDKEVAFKHPKGGLRCATCPRPA